MSNKREKQSSIKHCVYCGANIDKGQVYCPKCGKLVVKFKEKAPSREGAKSTSENQQKKGSRKCPGCGSIISSPILEQCPICNTKLEKSTVIQAQTSIQESQRKTGFIFTNKKLVPEQKFVLNKATWNLKEGLSVFGNSIMVYIIIRLLITVIVTFQLPLDGSVEAINITTILLSQLPDLLFGIYPIWYIYSKKHDMKKLGFWYAPKKYILIGLIALIGGVILILINNLSGTLIDFFIQLDINSEGIISQIAIENQIIREAEVYWIILLVFLLNLSVFSTEIVYRGVLHNTLKTRFGDGIIGKFSTIILVALIYSLLYLVFSLPFGFYFFLIEFLFFLILGVLYEVTKNIYTSIIASIIYNSVLIVLVIIP